MLHGQLAEAIDMVRVEMGEEDRFDPSRRQPHAAQVTPCPGAGVHHEEMLSRDNAHARTRALGIGKRASGAA